MGGCARRYAEQISGSGRRALVTRSGRILSEQPKGWLGTERAVVPPGGGELLLGSGLLVFAEPLGHEDAYLLRGTQLEFTTPRRSVLKLRLLGHERVAGELNGRALKLGLRQAEILAVLVAHPAGLTSAQLADELYGDARRRARARVDVHRLRKLLGGAIDRGTYRLSIDVESDVARVRALLGRGDVAEAAEHYPGPLLPDSRAPGVVREREGLETWLRHAVLSCADADALWAWVQCESGREDVAAWKRLLVALDFPDPRRSPCGRGAAGSARRHLACSRAQARASGDDCGRRRDWRQSWSCSRWSRRLITTARRWPRLGFPRRSRSAPALQRPRPVPAVELIDEHGKPASLGQWHGKLDRARALDDALPRGLPDDDSGLDPALKPAAAGGARRPGGGRRGDCRPVARHPGAPTRPTAVSAPPGSRC